MEQPQQHWYGFDPTCIRFFSPQSRPRAETNLTSFFLRRNLIAKEFRCSRPWLIIRLPVIVLSRLTMWQMKFLLKNYKDWNFEKMCKRLAQAGSATIFRWTCFLMNSLPPILPNTPQDTYVPEVRAWSYPYNQKMCPHQNYVIWSHVTILKNKVPSWVKI